MLAFCGTGGSLIDVPSPLPTEGWSHVRSGLEPLLELIKEVRMEAGYSALESMPAFPATDFYGKHARAMRRLYSEVWSVLRVVADVNTPKGHAKRRKILNSDMDGELCTITGDPMHCIINLRKLVSPQCNDARDFISDYTEIINC